MALIDKQFLVTQIAPPLDLFLVTQLLDEFISIERRFIQRDWEPAELDGGQFAEILARIVYHRDSGNLNLGKDFGDCLKYLRNDQVPHAMQPRQDALLVVKVLETIYNFRSKRGAVHISPTYQANHMDSKLVIESVRWCMNEALRIFWTGDREKVAKAIRELLQFDVPAIGVFDGLLMVQRTDLSALEETLLLLHYSGEAGMSRKDIGRYCQASATGVTRALDKLKAPNCREIIQLPSGNYRLTDLGSKRIREHLAEKLLIQ